MSPDFLFTTHALQKQDQLKYQLARGRPQAGADRCQHSAQPASTGDGAGLTRLLPDGARGWGQGARGAQVGGNARRALHSEREPSTPAASEVVPGRRVAASPEPITTRVGVWI